MEVMQVSVLFLAAKRYLLQKLKLLEKKLSTHYCSIIDINLEKKEDALCRYSGVRCRIIALVKSY